MVSPALSDPNFRQDIEVPETLLKKRKQNEKAREERVEKAAAAKKVRFALSPTL
jgi:large subunit ribosomal protein L7e